MLEPLGSANYDDEIERALRDAIFAKKQVNKSSMSKFTAPRVARVDLPTGAAISTTGMSPPPCPREVEYLFGLSRPYVPHPPVVFLAGLSVFLADLSVFLAGRMYKDYIS